MSGPSRAQIPGAYLEQMTELVERLGVSTEELLEGSGLTKAALQDPATRIDLPVYQALVRRAHELTGEDGLGFYMGLKMRISTHGFLGFAAMTAKDVRGAIEIGVRYAATRSPAIGLRLSETEDEAILELIEHFPLNDTREFVVAGLMVGLAHIGEAITGAPIYGRAHASFPEPAAFHRFRHLLPGEVRFNQRNNCLIFPREALDRPLVMADPVAAALALQQCERELEALERSRGIAARVVEELQAPGGGYRTLEEIALALHVSARTLKRQLAAEGTTFSDVLDGIRKTKALELLGSSEDSVDAIAAALGYSDTANFTRAFKRWTGSTPAAYRKNS
ncbi:MAG: AraC family transcriptional regulator [Myxococcota bacterium]